MTTPAAEVRSFVVTIPANTPLTAPVTTAVSFPPRTVTGVHWKVPPGPSGLMGWRLTMNNGLPVVPIGGGWIITDDDSDTWTLTGQPDSGAWEVTGYNTDIYDHAVYVDFLCDLIGQTPAPLALPSNAELSSPLSVSTSGVLAG